MKALSKSDVLGLNVVQWRTLLHLMTCIIEKSSASCNITQTLPLKTNAYAYLPKNGFL